MLNADLTKIRGLETGTRNILNKFGIFSLQLHGRKFELRTNDPCYKLRRTKLFEDFHKSLIFFLTFWLCNIRLVYIRMNICISLYRLWWLKYNLDDVLSNFEFQWFPTQGSELFILRCIRKKLVIHFPKF